MASVAPGHDQPRLRSRSIAAEDSKARFGAMTSCGKLRALPRSCPSACAASSGRCGLVHLPPQLLDAFPATSPGSFAQFGWEVSQKPRRPAPWRVVAVASADLAQAERLLNSTPDRGLGRAPMANVSKSHREVVLAPPATRCRRPPRTGPASTNSASAKSSGDRTLKPFEGAPGDFPSTSPSGPRARTTCPGE